MKFTRYIFKVFVYLFFILTFQAGFGQNVGISTNSAFVPDNSAALDVSYANKGLLIPRVALTATNSASPITSPATSLLVYNTATTGTSPTNVIPGFYYWNGSAWVLITISAQATGPWSTTGNTGTTAGTNFLGTTDAIDFVIKTFNTERARINSQGDVSIGGTALNATNPEQLLVNAGTTSSFNVISGKGSIDNYLQLNIQNNNSGDIASSDVVASNDLATETTNFIDMGINSTGNASTGVIGGPSTAYLYGMGNDFAIGNGTSGKNLLFFTGGIAANERMRIDGNGNVGIGIQLPTAALHLKSQTATAGSAPIKLSSNTTVMTTPEAGAVEFDGTNYFASAGSPAVRYTLAKTLTATAVLDFPSTTASNSSILTFTLNGAVDGDVVALGVPNAATNGNTAYYAYVSAANTITVRFLNNNPALGAAIDPVSATFRVSVIRY